ncbi:unnamed protein product [Rotaria sp. Silwood1]|nr:unnamed protein product [Rotaria sp. Silwood1]
MTEGGVICVGTFGGGDPFNIIKDLRSMDKNISLGIDHKGRLVQLTLPYVDCLILNEIEIGLLLKQTFQQGTIS